MIKKRLSKKIFAKYELGKEREGENFLVGKNAKRKKTAEKNSQFKDFGSPFLASPKNKNMRE
jgi:hypothetical protein